MTLINDLQWRHAAKAYNPNKKVSSQDLEKILEVIRLTPTSSGLQPFRIIAIEDKALRAELIKGALNPDCMRDCSHILVFAAWDKYTDERIEAVYDFTCEERGLPKGTFSAYTDKLKLHFQAQTEAQQFDHAAKQAYIALGLALAQAAELKIDATPAEGINPAVFDEVLDLPAQGLKTTMIMYLGYTDEERDWLKPMKKVRIPMTELVTFK